MKYHCSGSDVEVVMVEISEKFQKTRLNHKPIWMPILADTLRPVVGAEHFTDEHLLGDKNRILELFGFG